MKLKVNGETQDLGSIDDQMPLLWALRDRLGLVGTKYGCGISQCGACTVLVNNVAVKSCSYPLGSVGEDEVTTIEGLVQPDGTLNAVQQAWVDHDVAQCGYCQSGQVMAAEGLLRENPQPDDNAIDEAMSSNICRCGTYTRIRAAIKTASGQFEAAE